MKKYTIEDLAQGRCAVINDGSVEELREVLRRAFPEDCDYKNWVNDWARSNYYYSIHSGKWIRRSYTPVPAQSVKDFLVEEDQPFQYEYKWYDVREVLPDERFDGKMVSVVLNIGGNIDYASRFWDNNQEAFLTSLAGYMSNYVFYWCPLPALPQ